MSRWLGCFPFAAISEDVALHPAKQETGRAGRDGAPAAAILYYSYGDAKISRHMIKQSAQESGCAPEQLQCNLESLDTMVGPCGLQLCLDTG